MTTISFDTCKTFRLDTKEHDDEDDEIVVVIDLMFDDGGFFDLVLEIIDLMGQGIGLIAKANDLILGSFDLMLES